jgi:hypothetical protein
MDFSLERIRTLEPDSHDEQYLLEISWLYNRIVLTGSQIPVIDLANELALCEVSIAECIRNSLNLGFLNIPKRGTFEGTISQKALRKLNQVGITRLRLNQQATD